MPKAEGFQLDFVGIDKRRIDLLETFPYSGGEQKITYVTEEFSPVCPFSGLPDLGTLTLEYYPDASIVELKSLKYYLTSFRTIGIYQEHVTDVLFQDLKNLLKPKKLKLKLVYKTRGGIDTTTEMSI